MIIGDQVQFGAEQVQFIQPSLPRVTMLMRMGAACEWQASDNRNRR
ncbi:MAG: hypothetical protein N838_16445 [Thiohalocapsa sp. PB-PSB1]|nr:MAG: hypothetical protein N838_16445 [Thiohalocapsa sp. PB-PSB1]